MRIKSAISFAIIVKECVTLNLDFFLWIKTTINQHYCYYYTHVRVCVCELSLSLSIPIYCAFNWKLFLTKAAHASFLYDL